MQYGSQQQSFNFLASEYRLNIEGMMPLKVSLALENTIYFVHQPNQYQHVHMTLEGQVLFKITSSSQSTAEFVMPDSNHVIYESFEGQKHTLKALDLRTYQITTFKHDFLSAFNFKMFYFRSSKLVCIVEEDANVAKVRRISYYCWESKKQNNTVKRNLRFLKGGNFPCEDMISWCSIHKADDHSKLCWKRRKNSYILANHNSYSFCFINDHQQISYHYFTIPTFVGQHMDLSESIDICWQLENGQYLLQPRLTLLKDKYSEKLINKKGSQNPQKNQFEIELSDNLHDFSIEELKFYYKGKKDHIVMTGDKYKCFYLNKIFVLVNTDYDIKFNTRSQVFYINFEEKEIIAVDEWKTPGQANHWQIDWHDELLLETIYHTGQKYTIRLVDLNRSIRDVYMHMLLHINDDFDDDMLQDSIELLY